VQVVRIFTDMSISPSLSLRQYVDRYTFRAGRNLPDKEFRYLWTVIVTAAVYQGLGRKRSYLKTQTIKNTRETMRTKRRVIT